MSAFRLARDICGSGAEPAVRAAGVGGDAVADEAEHGGERDELRVGSGWTAARATAVAARLWMRSSAQASWRASAGDWPRSSRRVPRTDAFK